MKVFAKPKSLKALLTAMPKAVVFTSITPLNGLIVMLIVMVDRKSVT